MMGQALDRGRIALGASAIGRTRNRLMLISFSVAILHALVLFEVIPALSTRLRPLYNQNFYADGYDDLATNLVQGHGYRLYPDTARTLLREPGYPVFLAGIFLVSRYSFTAVKVANLFLALATAATMLFIASRALNNQVLGLLSALLFLFHPGTLIAESRGGVEILFTFLLALYALTVYRALESKRTGAFAVSGLALGLTVLVKSTPLMFPVILLPYLLIFRRREYTATAACRNVLSMVLASFLVMSPWIVRNYAVAHKFVPAASVLGISAHAGQYNCAHIANGNWAVLDHQASLERKRLAIDLGYRFKEVPGAYYQAFYSTDDELKFSSILLRNVINNYRESPRLYCKVIGYNLFNLWFAGKTRQTTLLNIIVQTPYLILALLGSRSIHQAAGIPPDCSVGSSHGVSGWRLCRDPGASQVQHTSHPGPLYPGVRGDRRLAKRQVCPRTPDTPFE